MKALAIFQSIVIIFLGWILWSNRADVSGGTNELQHQIEATQHKIDSVTRVIQATRDSLDQAFLLLNAQKSETDKAHKQTAIERKKYEQIRFNPTTSDRARDSILSVLYPSFKPVR